MELDLQSLYGLHVRTQLYSLTEAPHPPPPPPNPPAFGLIYEGAISQTR
jgi:hypothetical protein